MPKIMKRQSKVARCSILRRSRCLLGLAALLSWSLLSGCWATWSELKKERRLREVLESQFRAFKREQRAKDQQFFRKQAKTLAKQSALLARLRLHVSRVSASLKTLENRVKQGQGGVVEVFATLEKLQRKFQNSLGQIQELQKSIQDLLKNQPDRDKRFQEIQKKYEKLLKNQQALAEQAIPAKLFARAEKALKAKSYPNALRLFKLFVKRFGRHELADNAGVHIGDIHRLSGRTNQAIAAYADVARDHPNGSALPVALLWLGKLHYNIGECRTGRRYLRRLMRYRRHAPRLARVARSLYRNWRRECRRKRRRSRRRRRRR